MAAELAPDLPAVDLRRCTFGRLHAESLQGDTLAVQQAQEVVVPGHELGCGVADRDILGENRGVAVAVRTDDGEGCRACAEPASDPPDARLGGEKSVLVQHGYAKLCMDRGPGASLRRRCSQVGLLRCPISACARAVLTARPSVARSYAPTCRCPLTKKLGVPATPLTSALSTSAATCSLHRRAPRSSVNDFISRPSCAAYRIRSLGRSSVLVLEQQVVHRPEGSLRRGRLGCLGRQLRFGCTSLSGR